MSSNTQTAADAGGGGALPTINTVVKKKKIITNKNKLMVYQPPPAPPPPPPPVPAPNIQRPELPATATSEEKDAAHIATIRKYIDYLRNIYNDKQDHEDIMKTPTIIEFIRFLCTFDCSDLLQRYPMIRALVFCSCGRYSIFMVNPPQDVRDARNTFLDSHREEYQRIQYVEDRIISSSSSTEEFDELWDTINSIEMHLVLGNNESVSYRTKTVIEGIEKIVHRYDLFKQDLEDLHFIYNYNTAKRFMLNAMSYVLNRLEQAINSPGLVPRP